MPCWELCIVYFENEVNALVIINMQNSEGGKECLDEALSPGFSMCRDMCDLHLYSGVCEARDSQSLLPQRGQLCIRHCCCHWLDQVAKPLSVAKESIKMCRWGQLLAKPLNSKMTAWGLANCADPCAHLWSWTSGLRDEKQTPHVMMVTFTKYTNLLCCLLRLS